MSEDLTRKLSQSGEDRILNAIKNLDARVVNLDVRVGGIESRLEHLEQKVDERLHDTRPIWQKVIDDIKNLQSSQHAMQAELSELNTTVHNINRNQIVINEVVRRIQVDVINFEDRLHNFLLNRDQQNSST